MDGCLKGEIHSLSQLNTSNLLGNGLKEEESFVLESGSLYCILIQWNKCGSKNRYLKNM